MGIWLYGRTPLSWPSVTMGPPSLSFATRLLVLSWLSHPFYFHVAQIDGPRWNERLYTCFICSTWQPCILIYRVATKNFVPLSILSFVSCVHLSYLPRPTQIVISKDAFINPFILKLLHPFHLSDEDVVQTVWCYWEYWRTSAAWTCSSCG